MTAVDTNVLVRLIARDDPVHLRAARALLESVDCFIPDSVLLEAEWVLRSGYGATREQIHAEFLTILGLDKVIVSDPVRLESVLAWYADGLDFADAMHLAHSQHASSFVTFDRQFIRRATGKGSCPVNEPAAPQGGSLPL